MKKFQYEKEPANIPLVSVGMPIFNAQNFLGEALYALLNQSYPNLEIIVSDNCSTDDSVLIVKNFMKKDSRIRLIEQETNMGAIRNFEFVLEESKGEFFFWAAHDDLWDEKFVEIIISKFRNSVDQVHCQYSRIDVTGIIRETGKYHYINHPWLRTDFNHSKFYNVLIYYLNRNPYWIYAGIYRTKSVKSISMRNFGNSIAYTDAIFLSHFLAKFNTLEINDRLFKSRIIKKPYEYFQIEQMKFPQKKLSEKNKMIFSKFRTALAIIPDEIYFSSFILSTIWKEFGLIKSLIFVILLPFFYVTIFTHRFFSLSLRNILEVLQVRK